MASTQTSRKRRLSSDHEDEQIRYDSDSDCIVVATRPWKQPKLDHFFAKPVTREPLIDVEPLQTHNQRRRVVECVLITTDSEDSTRTGPPPKSRNAANIHGEARQAGGMHIAGRARPKASISRPLSTFSGHSRSLGSGVRSLVGSASNGTRTKAEPTQKAALSTTRQLKNLANKGSPTAPDVSLLVQGREEPSSRRPLRRVPRPSYKFDTQLEDSSEDELQGFSMPPRRRNAKAQRNSHDSDYEEHQPSALSAHEEETEDHSSGDGSSVQLPEEDDSEPAPVTTSRSKSKKSLTSVKSKSEEEKISPHDMRKLYYPRKKDIPKGLDPSLPPLSDIRDIFTDMTKRAINLGFSEALEALKARPLRVATMCSGTESPLLALDMVSNAVKNLTGQTLSVEHLFSAEIVPYKQAYIQRNFAPAIIFRDITEFVEAVKSTNPMATTAFGGRVALPTNADIVVAGTSCVDYSGLNNNRKDIDDDGESGQTWYGAFAYCKAYRPAIIIFENVGNAKWTKMLQHYREIGYESAGVFADTKDYYIPHTRQRGYMVCFDKSKSNHNIGGMATKWQDLMAAFRRLASSPVSDFLIPNDQIKPRPQRREDDTKKEYDWALCQILQMQERRKWHLGNARPITGWQESGAITVPENGSEAWYRAQVERVLDTIDALHLRRARAGIDVRYKTRIWDLSQNLYLISDSQPFGVTGCITPDGQPFVSDAGRVLTPEETIKLQGLPLDRISFTTETMRNIQDLAGNAMTTTVVGSALLAALIVGHELIPVSSHAQGTQMKQTNAPYLPEPAEVQMIRGEMQEVNHTPDEIAFLATSLLDKVRKAARRCHCEDALGLTNKPIQECEDCGHTACISCGGSPPHAYRQDQFLSNNRVSPNAFEAELKSHLPLRLTFSKPAILQIPANNLENERLQAYCKIVADVTSTIFSFSEIRRTSRWTAEYVAPNARLVLTLEDYQAEWRLFALPATDLPSDDWLRLALQQPVGKAVVGSSLVKVDWLWRMPSSTSYSAGITAEGAQVPTWRARWQLPGYTDHTQPEKLSIAVKTKQADIGMMLSGAYRYLSKCGTACESLYQKVSRDRNERPLYLFLDPTRTGDPSNDTFVFSHDIARLEYDEVRPIVAHIKAPWRPWPSETQQDLEPATVVVDDLWVSLKKPSCLQTEDAVLSVQVAQQLPLQHSCDHADMLIACRTTLPDSALRGTANRVEDLQFLRTQAWIFEAMRRHWPTGEWQTLSGANLHVDHDLCAPLKPSMRWRFAAKDSSVQPYEDPLEATMYERAIKARPQSMVVSVELEDEGSASIAFGVNLVSLAHRALGRLPRTTQITSSPTIQWSLDTSKASNQTPRVPRFSLQATRGVEPYSADVGMSVSLFPKQRLSLAWMREQESGTGVDFLIEEAEEATLRVLGWRAEVRASTIVSVKGGICADHPGFGKTITSLALIHTQFQDRTQSEVKQDIKLNQAKSLKGLLPSSATVIICPSSLVNQWRDEIAEKLRYEKGVLVVAGAKDLAKYTMADFEDARIVVVNRNLFSNDGYTERIASFAAVPGPATRSGRAYAQWLEHALDQVPEHLRILEDTDLSNLRKHIQDKYAERVRSEEFQATVPSKRLRGSAVPAGKGKNKSPAKTVKSPSTLINTSTVGQPLLEMFHFDRIIVDEFHEYDAKEYVSIKRLRAEKRWGLSATPAIGDFYDVAQMAGLVGIPLRVGSDAKGAMKATNIARLRKDMTKAELFDAMMQTPSNATQTRIYEGHQQFLDKFVRRNIMDFDEMEVNEHLVPVTLDMDHRAMYAELSQHLNSLDMRITKGKKEESATDRELRLHTAAANAKSAEEALSRQAAFFERADDEFAHASTAIGAMVLIREQDVQDITMKLNQAIDIAKAKEAEELSGWQEEAGMETLGDAETILIVSRLIGGGNAMSLTASKPKPKSKRKSKATDDDDDDDSTKGKKEKKREKTADVYKFAKRLTTAMRSLRYLRNVQRIQEASQRKGRTNQCESVDCHSQPTPSLQLAASAACGHMICNDCYNHMNEQDVHLCPASGCSSSMQSYHLLWSSKMGDLSTNASTSTYGAKISKAMDILETIETKGERAILFVQFEEQLNEVEHALKDRDINAIVVKSVSQAGKQIEQFRNSDVKNTVIVLNASDETAAGSNLQIANHVIFLSPLLKDSQYGYEATMAQAIGRVRRHGQKKPIHVYRIVALHTIDVDILEQRERRVDAITEQGAPFISAPARVKELDMAAEPVAGRTQLVKLNGSFSLRPQSWLLCYGEKQGGDDGLQWEAVKGKRRVMGYEDWSAEVKFSKTFTQDDD